MSLSRRDAAQIIQDVYDAENHALRIESAANSGGTTEVSINNADDSIAIGTPTELFTATDLNGKVGLDVNVLNQLDITQSGLSIGLKAQSLTIGDVAVAVPASALVNRNALIVRNMGSNPVYFGDASVTPANGYPKLQYEELTLDIKDNSGVTLYAVCDSGATSEVRILELA